MKKVNLSRVGSLISDVTIDTTAELGASALLGTIKTLKDSTWEKKALGISLAGNLISGVFDMDTTFGILGETFTGIDGKVDQIADVIGITAAGSLIYKAFENSKAIYESEKELDELLEEILPQKEKAENKVSETLTQSELEKKIEKIINKRLTEEVK